MYQILENTLLAPNIHEMVVEAPLIAQKAEAGHFVLAMADETGERIPLTVADYDRDRGTLTLVVMVVGTSSRKITQLKAGQRLYALVGPLGHASEIDNYGTVVMVAGGVAFTLGAVALIDWRAAALVLVAFCLSGTPMILGSMWRHMQKGAEAKTSIRQEVARRD